MEEEILISENTTQFFGAFTLMSPHEIDELAMRYKELLPMQKQELEDLKVEVYCALIPHCKNELYACGVATSDIEEALSISWEVVEYLLDKWEVKYYDNRNLIKNNLKGAKKNSFYGYFTTYYKSIFYQKWNYSKDFNGNLIKKSKTVDLKIKADIEKITKRNNINKKKKEVMIEKVKILNSLTIESNFITNESGEMVEREYEDTVSNGIPDEVRLHLQENYKAKEIECLLYIAKLKYDNKKELKKYLGYSLSECEELLEEVMYKAQRDKQLYELWEKGI